MIRQLPTHLERAVIAARLRYAHDHRTHRVYTRPRSARVNTSALAATLVAALLAGCGGGSTPDQTGHTSPQAPTTAVEPAQSTAAEPEADPDASSDPYSEPASNTPPEPERGLEPESAATSPSDAAPSESAVEPESDAGSWVDRRQDDVLEDVHENNLDAIEAWTR